MSEHAAEGARADGSVLLVLDGDREPVEIAKKNRTSRIVRDWTHPSLNVWVNKTAPWVRDRLHAQFVAKVVDTVLRTAPAQQFHVPVAITVSYYFRGARRRDLDNHTPKFILDGLVESRLLADDDSEHVLELAVRIFRNDLDPRTEILIRPTTELDYVRPVEERIASAMARGGSFDRSCGVDIFDDMHKPVSPEEERHAAVVYDDGESYVVMQADPVWSSSPDHLRVATPRGDTPRAPRGLRSRKATRT